MAGHSAPAVTAAVVEKVWWQVMPCSTVHPQGKGNSGSKSSVTIRLETAACRFDVTRCVGGGGGQTRFAVNVTQVSS
jgi:hypothetical protein